MRRRDLLKFAGATALAAPFLRAARADQLGSTGLMHRSSAAPRRLFQQEDQRDHARTDDCEKLEYIDIAQDTRLCLDRLVDDQNRFPLSIGETCTAGQQMTREQPCSFKIGRAAARYVLH